MRRAIFLAGWPSPALPLREYTVVSLAAGDGARFSALPRTAAGLDVELSASWLLLREGAGRVPVEVAAGLRGCLTLGPEAGLRRQLTRLDAAAARSGVVTDLPTVERRCRRLRAAGKRIVFTNGVFDLFHLGHLRLLQAAAARGDVLVVGINSDDSARRLKGRARPAVPQFARAEIVAACRGVGFCAIFDQPDPRELLRAVRPDVLAKGSEYTRAAVVGGRMVREWGGEVALIPHVTGWSTTEILGRMRGRRR